MSHLLRKLDSFTSRIPTLPFFLLLLCLAAYAPFIPWLGFYWDDFPISWIASTMGSEGLTRYFSTNRPFWGMIYKLTTPLLGSTPIVWQITGLLLRWGTGLAFWNLIRQIWPGKKVFAGWAAVMFVIYPGFSQQSIAFMYSHFYIVLLLFLLSLSFTVLALRKPRWFWLFTAAALVTSAMNLLAMEYFFLLDLLRPVIIWLVLRNQSAGQPVSNRRFISRALLLWLPYLAVFIGAIVWRSLFLGFQTYQPTLMSRLRTDPLPALLRLFQTALQDVWATSFGAWLKAFRPPTIQEVGEVNLQRFWMVVAAAGVAALLYLLWFRRREPGAERREWLWQPLVVGGLALFIAGGPFWLTDLEIGLVFPNDRFTLPFMIGASLLLPALLQLLPIPHAPKALLLAVLLGFAIGSHFQNGIVYRRDWSVQKSFFWQMLWRMPDIQPGTTLLINEMPLIHYTDNSLAAPLNWIYSDQKDPLRMDYMLYYPTLRAGRESWITSYQKDMPIERDYLAATFYGNTSQVVSLYFNPPGCLHVLDADLDAVNWMVPEYLRETLPLTTTAPILAEPAAGKDTPYPPEHIFGSEPQPNWCYYYEKADLARQYGDWESIVALGEQAFNSDDYPNDPIERLPFIEGYAHTGNWQRAVELSQETRAITPVMKPVLCRLWARIENETPAEPEQQEAVRAMQVENECAQ